MDPRIFEMDFLLFLQMVATLIAFSAQAFSFLQERFGGEPA
jgi:hypothetical protein